MSLQVVLMSLQAHSRSPRLVPFWYTILARTPGLLRLMLFTQLIMIVISAKTMSPESPGVLRSNFRYCQVQSTIEQTRNEDSFCIL